MFFEYSSKFEILHSDRNKFKKTVKPGLQKLSRITFPPKRSHLENPTTVLRTRNLKKEKYLSGKVE
jgi:hypothetical protein